MGAAFVIGGDPYRPKAELLALVEASLQPDGGSPWSRWTREEILARLDGAVCKGNVDGVAVIEPVSGGTVWTPQREVDAFIADGLLTEVTADGVTRLVRP